MKSTEKCFFCMDKCKDPFMEKLLITNNNSNNNPFRDKILVIKTTKNVNINPFRDDI